MAAKTIRGKISIPGFNTDLDIDVTDPQYEAVEKDLPTIPEYRDPKTGAVLNIIWFNNFGVRKVGTTTFEKNVPPYRVFLQALPDAPNNVKRRLFVYSNGQVQEITNIQNAGSNRVMFTLNVGDPPTGYYP